MNSFHGALLSSILALAALAGCSKPGTDVGSSESNDTDSPFVTTPQPFNYGADAGAASDATAPGANADAAAPAVDGDLAAQAEARYTAKETAQPATGDSVLAFQVDDAAPAFVEAAADDSPFATSALDVEFPEVLGSIINPNLSIKAAGSPALTISMKSASGAVALGSFACADVAGKITVTIDNDVFTSDPASGPCTIRITKSYDEALPPEVAVVAPPSRIHVGDLTATVVDAAGVKHAVRAGFLLVEARL